MTAAAYEASPIKRQRATKAEMEERAEFFIDYASEHGPVTVRGLYYQTEVASLPGISKDDKDYDKVQRQVLHLRREGRLDYSNIADATRWMRKPKTHDSIEEALKATGQLYRKNLWLDADDYVEIWVEKDDRWVSMRQRCFDPGHPCYPDYGGRGISICDDWRSFENFYADMLDPPLGLSIDRINNDGNYEPSNCLWASASVQVRNRRRKRKAAP